MRPIAYVVAPLVLVLLARPARAQTAAADIAGIAALNRTLDDATRRMDTDAIIALWEEHGVSILPQMPPLVGRPAIAGFIRGAVAQLAGARMLSFTNRCAAPDVAGDWASEWCLERQQVALADGRTIDSWGHLLYVMHRGADGRWRLSREMWNQGTPDDSTSRTRAESRALTSP